MIIMSTRIIITPVADRIARISTSRTARITVTVMVARTAGAPRTTGGLL